MAIYCFNDALIAQTESTAYPRDFYFVKFLKQFAKDTNISRVYIQTKRSNLSINFKFLSTNLVVSALNHNRSNLVLNEGLTNHIKAD